VPWLDELWLRRSSIADVPAKLIWGTSDPAFPEPMRSRLAGVFDRCEVSLQEGIGHFVPEELGELVVPEVAGFLKTAEAAVVQIPPSLSGAGSPRP
jgi:haloalkane dehalogenase